MLSLSILSLIFSLSWLWVPLVIIWFVLRNRKPRSTTVSTTDQNRDAAWRQYLQSFRTVVQDERETALLEALIRGETRDEYGGSSAPLRALAVAEATTASDAAVSYNDAELEPVIEAEIPKAPKSPIDSTLLLLYFGAFLLVASVGLFVALGGLGGVMRTIIVALTAAGLYSGGLWLYEHNEKLAQAGISFVGTGMIIAPLTGVAWYNLVTLKAGGAVIWLITSLVCAALYAYSYKRIKNDLVAYLLIGSFVSVVESSVLTLNLPQSGYVWGLVAAGIVLQIMNRRRAVSRQLEVAANTSAELLTPLSIIGSALLLPQLGSLQLAVTLILSGTYYVLLCRWQTANRFNYCLAAQVSYVAALANIVYASQPHLAAVGMSLVVATGVYALIMSQVKPELLKQYGLLEVSVATSTIAIICSLANGWPLVISILASIVLAIVVWLKLAHDEALQAAGLLAILLPFVVAQYALPRGLGSSLQLGLSGAVALLMTGLVWASIRSSKYKPYYASASFLFWLAVAAALVPAAAFGAVAVVLEVAVILIICVLLRQASRDQTWLIGSSLVIFIPLVYLTVQGGTDSLRFSLAVLATVVWNAGLSLVTRQALIRGLVVVSLLLMPVALGGGGLGFHWGTVGYSWGYLAASLACLLARAIARGKLLVSFKVPIASYYTEASQAYVVGYVVAGLASLSLSVMSDQSRWLTTVLLAVTALIVIAVMRIEKSPEVLALLPGVLQLFILSGLRPDFQNSTQLGLTGLILTAAAAGCYFAPQYFYQRHQSASRLVRQVSLYLSFAGPALALLTPADPSRLFPVSLFVAGCLTVHHNWSRPQAEREASIAICLAAVHWLLYLSGVHNLQFHSHLLAVFLAGFAYWRYQLGDRASSRGYQQALYTVVTVPLAIQSLQTDAGSSYGLILIAEQVGFMIIGAILPPDERGQHFLLRLGLWTGLAAVLFQLRGLGYVFLTLLAVIIIGVAVYRLQKTPHDK